MAHEIHVDHRGGGKREWRGLDGAVARLAPPQHGVVSRGQLLRLGLSGRAIERRLERGWLHPLYRGVYALGHPTPSREGRWMAAVLAGEPAAVLSHSSAAALWGIADAGAGRTEVTVPANRRSTHAIEFHRSRLPADEVTVANGIPVTSVPRTIFDLAPGLSTRRVERAINEAEVLHLWDQLSLDDLLHRYPGRRGSATVRGALHGRRSGATTTRSELEERFMALVDQAGLPRPEVNVQLHGFEVDFLWRDAGLIVELDGRAFHSTARAFERDRERDRILQAAGWRVVRVTWRQLEATPEQVVADLQALIRG